MSSVNNQPLTSTLPDPLQDQRSQQRKHIHHVRHITAEERDAQRERDRIRKRARRQSMSEEQRYQERERNRLRNQEYRQRIRMRHDTIGTSTPTQLPYVLAPSPVTSVNITTDNYATPSEDPFLPVMQQHLQSEISTLTATSMGPLLNIDNNIIQITLDSTGPSTSNTDLDFHPDLNLDVDVCPNTDGFNEEINSVEGGDSEFANDIFPSSSILHPTEEDGFNEEINSVEGGHSEFANDIFHFSSILRPTEEAQRSYCSIPSTHPRRGYHNRARNYVDSSAFQSFQLPPSRICLHCSAKLFAHETSELCCLNGKVSLPSTPIPNELLDLFKKNCQQAVDFRQNIRSYNHVHAFTSMGVHIDENLASGQNGIYTYRAKGSIYHRIGDLLPQEGQRPRYLQMYVYDTDHEIDNRLVENNSLDRAVLAILKKTLDSCNPFVGILRQIAQRDDYHNVKLHIKDHPDALPQYNLPATSQVAAILDGGEDPFDRNDRDIIIETAHGHLYHLPDTAGFYDPLQYPLLFPYGTFGWDLTIFASNLKRVSCRAFYSYKLQIRDACESLLLRAGRLLQQYVVDNYVKISTQQLRYIRDHQEELRADLYQGLKDAFAIGQLCSDTVGRKIVLPASYIGSPRDMHERYHDAMAIVQKFGKPDLFITMTCNPNWPEIRRELLSGQVASDRPDLTTRIFHSKCEELKKDLFKRGVLGKVIAHVHVIEFQKRGLPHAHFLLILDQADKLRGPEDYDQVVRAEIPDPFIEPELHAIVLRHMIHGPCGILNANCVCMKNNKCKKNFPKQFSLSTFQGDDSFPIYMRRNLNKYLIHTHRGDFHVDNQWVVPYNPWLLKKYDCHLNVEICSTIQSVKYLYKYVYKGVDRVSLQLSSSDSSGSITQDEIKQFVDARWICPQEAVWRIFKFPLNRMYPSVYSLQVHLENMQHVIFREGESISDLVNGDNISHTMLSQFFQLNVVDENARQYLYREIPEHYTWIKAGKFWQLRRGHNRVIGRLYTVSPSDSERYYLRILLNHVRGPTSYENLRTVGSHVCSTFKEAAEKLGLIEGGNDIRETLQEAIAIHMPYALRKLFVAILLHCNPPHVRDLWDEFHTYMMEDYSLSSSPDQAVHRLLKDINSDLSQYGKKLSDYNLPSFSNNTNEESTEDDLISEEQSVPVPLEDLSSIISLNEKQRYAFEKITDSVMRNESKVYFIDGPGGTGKTYLYRSILAYLRNAGHIAIATASSGIAAMMMPGGRTAHSRFKIPIPTYPTSTCTIAKHSPLAKLLCRSSLFIWDEATMTHRYTFEAVDRTLRDLTEVALPFGGKVFVLGGDFRQTPPVVPYGSRFQILDACLPSSPIWESIEFIHLIENMRARNDPSFSALLMRIGDGSETYTTNDMIKIPDDMVIPWQDDESLFQLIDFVFPNLHDHVLDDAYMMERAIITPTNEHVDKVNDTIISLFPSSSFTSFSFDSVESDLQQLYPEEFLNSISLGGLPPHKLILKLGCPIILLRNLNPKNGLCNGTRLLCRGFYGNMIYAEIMTGSFCGRPAFLPRIPLKSSADIRRPFVLTRKQFPVRLSFALTINKSQGQTIPHVGIYLPNHVFNHGQLYVAMSRGVSRNATKLLVKKGVLPGLSGFYTRNVVYAELLRFTT